VAAEFLCGLTVADMGCVPDAQNVPDALCTRYQQESNTLYSTLPSGGKKENWGENLLTTFIWK